VRPTLQHQFDSTLLNERNQVHIYVYATDKRLGMHLSGSQEKKDLTIGKPQNALGSLEFKTDLE
jgi:hypothetical protein